MGNFTNGQLEYRVGTLTTNGKQEKGQKVLARVGGHPAELDRGSGFLHDWITARSLGDQLNMQKIAATKAEEKAYNFAHAEISSLTETLYILFNDERSVLNGLGLPRRKAGGGKKKATTPESAAAATEEPSAAASEDTPEPDAPETDGPAKTPTADSQADTKRVPSRRRVDELAAWRRLCNNVKLLTVDDQEKMLIYEWDMARVDQTIQLVADVVAADLKQQEMISAHETQKGVIKACKATLLAWYRPLAKLARREIRKLPAHLREQYYALLGL
jgi:hypothetical protein